MGLLQPSMKSLCNKALRRLPGNSSNKPDKSYRLHYLIEVGANTPTFRQSTPSGLMLRYRQALPTYGTCRCEPNLELIRKDSPSFDTSYVKGLGLRPKRMLPSATKFGAGYLFINSLIALSLSIKDG
jgi:hypothetical protein